MRGAYLVSERGAAGSAGPCLSPTRVGKRINMVPISNIPVSARHAGSSLVQWLQIADYSIVPYVVAVYNL
jgi:hypothetical protein